MMLCPCHLQIIDSNQCDKCLMQKQECQTMSYPTEDPVIEQQQVYFTLNRKIIGVIFLAFSFLYMSLEQHRARYFVYISIATNLIYPLIQMQKHPSLTLRRVLVSGTFVTSMLYDIWTLYYPHKVFVYYIPQLVGTIGKIYHILSDEQADEQDIVQQLIKFQSKTQVFVIFYSLVYFILRLKYSWWKVLKLIMLLAIVRLKYSMHYGTRIGMRQLHFAIDHYCKYISLREYYQLFYLKLTRMNQAPLQNELQESRQIIF